MDDDELVTTPDAGGGGDAVLDAAGGSDDRAAENAAGGETLTIDGREYSADELREAVQSHLNRQSWERAYKQRDQRTARVRSVLEGAFGKTLDRFGDNDYADLAAFAEFNTRLRGDTTFRGLFADTLQHIYQDRGATPAQAAAAAQQQVRAVQAGQQTAGQALQQAQAGQLPPEVMARIHALEQREAERAWAGLANFLDTQIGKTLDATAGDLSEYRDHLRRAVLHGIAGYEDADLLRMAQTGELGDLLTSVAEREVKTTRAYLERAMKGTAGAMREARRGGTMPPIGSGAGRAVRDVQPAPGAGLRAFHERFRKDYVGE